MGGQVGFGGCMGGQVRFGGGVWVDRLGLGVYGWTGELWGWCMGG